MTTKVAHPASSSLAILDALILANAATLVAAYATDAVLALKGYAGPLLQRPVELSVLMLLPILARVHLPDYRDNNLRHSIALWRDHVHVLVPFAGLVLLNFLTALKPGSGLAADDGRTLYILVYRFIMFAGALSTAILLLRRGWRWVVIAGLLTLTGSIYYEVVNPGLFSAANGRAAGFLQNANNAATVVVLLTALSVRYDRMRLLDLGLILLAFGAVFSTLSRGGLAQFALFLVNYLYFTGRGRRLRQLLIAPLVVAVMATSGGALVTTLINNTTLFESDNAQRRLDALTFSGDAVFDTDETRLGLIERYFSFIDDHVLLGNGTGFSRAQPMGPHNVYIDFWVNNGLVGLVLFVWFMAGLTWLNGSRRFWPGFVFAQVALLGGFFTHVLMHIQGFLMLAGLSVGLSWGLAAQRSADAATGAPGRR